MKKILSLILCILVLASCVSCGSSKGNEATTTANDTKAETTSRLEALKLITLGTIDGRRYENSYLEIGAKLPEAWEYYSETQLKKLNGCSENMPDDEYLQKMNDAPAVIDMYAAHSNGTDTVEVTMEKISADKISAFKIDDYYEKYKSAYEIYYKDMGYTDIAFEKQNVTLGNQELPALRMTAKDTLDTDVYQLFVAKLEGSYCYCISLLSFEKDQTSIVSDFFYTIDE